MPISFEIPELMVSYDDPVFMGDCAPYPSKVWLKIKGLDLEMKITIRDIQLSSLMPEDPMFDPAPYYSQPM